MRNSAGILFRDRMDHFVVATQASVLTCLYRYLYVSVHVHYVHTQHHVVHRMVCTLYGKWHQHNVGFMSRSNLSCY